MSITIYKCTNCGRQSRSMPVIGGGCLGCGEKLTTIEDRYATEEARKEEKRKEEKRKEEERNSGNGNGSSCLVTMLAVMVFFLFIFAVLFV